MKKIYALIASALMMLPFSASAQTMTTDNTVLTDWGYRLEKDVNFVVRSDNGLRLLLLRDARMHAD